MKFWNFKNSADSAELLIYGEIVSERGWLSSDSEVSASEFHTELESLSGKDLTVRVNSPGGDVFAAHAIHNQLRAYKGHVTAVIDGIAASAASVVVMAAEKIIMPANSMMMIHNPALGLQAYYNEQDLQKCIDALKPIKESIIAAYMRHTTVDRAEVARMMDDETWLTADECVRLGFADEIDGQVEPVMRGANLVVNSVMFDTRKFSNLAGLQKCLDRCKPIPITSKKEINMSIKLSKLASFLTGLGLDVDNDIKHAENPAKHMEELKEPVVDTAKIAQDAVEAERQRVAALDELSADEHNTAVTSIVDMAKRTGKTVDDIQEYINAVKTGVTPAQRTMDSMLADANESGVESIKANPNSQKAKGESDEIKEMVEALSKCMVTDKKEVK